MDKSKRGQVEATVLTVIGWNVLHKVDRYMIAEDLEDEYGITISEEECLAWDTVGDICDLVVSRL